jgi:hypothetical protein
VGENMAPLLALAKACTAVFQAAHASPPLQDNKQLALGRQ